MGIAAEIINMLTVFAMNILNFIMSLLGMQ
jgi:hypothetical protein